MVATIIYLVLAFITLIVCFSGFYLMAKPYLEEMYYKIRYNFIIFLEKKNKK